MEPKVAALVDFGWNEKWRALMELEFESGLSGEPARVVRHDGVGIIAATARGQRQIPLTRRIEPAPVVGDWIMFDESGVTGALPRTSLLRRRDPMADVEQPLVANVDIVLIACGADRPVKPGRVHRVATQTWDAGALPIAILTKADLHEDPDLLATDLIQAIPGIEVIITAAATGAGINHLRERARDQTVAIIGESGAGKSTLVNALVSSEVALTGRVRQGDSKGRHTTTARELHPLPGGGVLIDTPGLRSMGLWTDADAVSSSFPDIEELAEECRFRDCAHETEPGCAVMGAVESGGLARQRLEAWHELQQEVAANELRSTEHARRKSERRTGRLVDEALKLKGRT